MHKLLLRCTKYEVHYHVSKHIAKCTKKHVPQCFIPEGLMQLFHNRWIFFTWINLTFTGFKLSFQKWSAEIYWLVSAARGYGGVLQAPNCEFVGKDPKDFGQNSIQMQENVVQFSTFGLIYKQIVTITTFTNSLKNVLYLLNQLCFDKLCLLFLVKKEFWRMFNYTLILTWCSVKIHYIFQLFQYRTIVMVCPHMKNCSKD